MWKLYNNRNICSFDEGHLCYLIDTSFQSHNNMLYILIQFEKYSYIQNSPHVYIEKTLSFLLPIHWRRLHVTSFDRTIDPFKLSNRFWGFSHVHLYWILYLIIFYNFKYNEHTCTKKFSLMIFIKIIFLSCCQWKLKMRSFLKFKVLIFVCIKVRLLFLWPELFFPVTTLSEIKKNHDIPIKFWWR